MQGSKKAVEGDEYPVGIDDIWQQAAKRFDEFTQQVGTESAIRPAANDPPDRIVIGQARSLCPTLKGVISRQKCPQTFG